MSIIVYFFLFFMYPAFGADNNFCRRSYTLFEKIPSDDLINHQKFVAVETIKYIRDHGTIPKSKKIGDLYFLFYRYEHEPEFQAKLREDPEVWKIFEKSELFSFEQAAAVDTWEYIAKYGAVPTRKNDYELFKRFRTYKDSQAFQDKLREDPKAWSVFENWMKYWDQLSPQVKTAMDTLDYISTFGSIPTKAMDKFLFARFLEYRDYPEFQAILKEDPSAWKIVQAWKPPRVKMGDPISTALEVIAYIHKNGSVPLRKDNSENDLFFRFHRFLSDPAFQARIVLDQVAWDVIENWQKLEKALNTRPKFDEP